MFNPKSSGKRIVYGAGLGIFLSIVFAEYSSAALYSIYHDSALFRSLTGWSPNKISDIALKISWAIAFLSCWWMIWRLDFLLSFAPHTRSKPTSSNNKKTKNSNGSRVRSDKKRTDNHRKKQKENKSEEQPEEPSKNQDIPNLKELHYGKVLELEDLNDAEAIKASYRKKIAQYHPDRVRAMGPEIRDVAEKKAKEVNEAYEYFRKKLKSPK